MVRLPRPVTLGSVTQGTMYRASNSRGVMRALVPVFALCLLLVLMAVASVSSPLRSTLRAGYGTLVRDLDETASPQRQWDAFQAAAIERPAAVAQPTTGHHRAPLTNLTLPGHQAMASAHAATPLPATLSLAGLTAAATPRRVQP